MKKIMTVILAIMICLQAFIPCLAFEELSKGSKGNAVVELQNRLNELGYDVGKADGDFGSKTEKAIRQFQQDNELAISGKLDNDTYVLLFSINTEDNNLPESKPDDKIEDTPLFLIEGTNGYGYCDSNGNTIISCQWAYAIDFSGDIAGVKDSSEKWGAINKSGNTVVACDWQSVHDITDGYICFQNGYGDAIRYAVFDSEGNEVLPPSEYRRHLYFGDGIAVWITENTGNPVCFDLTTHNTTQIDKYYRTVEEDGFSEGLLQVRHGYIDKAGKLIIDMSNQDYLLSAFHDGLALVYDNSNKKEGYIDTSGSLAIPFQWPGDCADDFSEGMARVKKTRDGLYGYINAEGVLAIPYLYKTAYPFQEGLACVQNTNGLWGFIDKNGNQVIDFLYNEAKSFKNGFSLVKVKDRPYYIDTFGNPAFAYFEGDTLDSLPNVNEAEKQAQESAQQEILKKYATTAEDWLTKEWSKISKIEIWESQVYTEDDIALVYITYSHGLNTDWKYALITVIKDGASYSVDRSNSYSADSSEMQSIISQYKSKFITVK